MTVAALGPGAVLASRYRLEDLLHDTGSARFWRAHDQVLDRDVALRLLRSNDPRAEPMLAAARNTAGLADGHLLRVLDAVRADDVCYVVHEWGDGMSLDALLDTGGLSPRRAAWVTREVAEGVATAHAYGVAHGRLLPRNVRVTDAGAVKIVGFAVDAVLHRPADTTPDPEAAIADDVADLGGVLYACLVGRWPRPQQARLPPAPFAHGRPLRPRQVQAGVPRPLDSICTRVLGSANHAGADGPATAEDIASALDRFLGEPGATAGPAQQASAATRGRAATTPDPGDPLDPEATQAGTPVFFDDNSVGWAAAASQTDDVGATGSVGHEAAQQPSHPAPTVWPMAEPAPSSDPPQAPSAGRSWLRLAGALAACAAVLVALVLAFQLTTTSPGTSEPTPTQPSAAPTAQSQPVRVRQVTDFDPLADPPEEHPAQAGNVVDGDPKTAWTTMTYYHDPELGGLKDGVGLLLDLGSAHQVGRVEISLLGKPTDLRLLAAKQGSGRPEGLGGLQRVDTATDASGTVTLVAKPELTARYLVVWLTSLPPVPGGYQGKVSQVSVFS